MNLTSSFLALAQLGMDDPQPKPDLPSKGSIEIETNGTADAAPEAAPPDRIHQEIQDLKQIDQAGTHTSPPRIKLPRVAKPGSGDPEPQERWPMTLQTAILIGLDNSEIVRVISFGAQGIPIGGIEPIAQKAGATAQASDAGPPPIVIARLNADASPYRFKTEVMAHLRSIEQQYWALASAQVRLRAAELVVSLTEEILKKENAEFHGGRGGDGDVAEAAQRLKQFKLDVVARTSDVMTAERQLRHVLDLPPADNRRIIPATPASEAKFEPFWDACVDAMLEQAPDIVERKTELRKLRDRIAVASANLPVVPMMAGSGQQRPDATKADPATRHQAARKEIELEGIIREQTRTLARLFVEIDAKRKQFETARRLRAASADRLDAQRAYYEEGRITIDRFLDAVSQCATALGTEAQYNAAYNTSIVALKEAKGTLLADHGIVVAELKPRKAIAARQPKPDAAVKPSVFTGPD
jgi:Outer membrane efflux protein